VGPPPGVGRPPVALTIAGSDSGGGAGIAADLKTFMALGVHGAVALTALTAQDTCGISSVHEVPPGFVREQIARVAGDLGVDAAKTGMLGSEEALRAVAEAVEAFGIRPLVVDPVLAASTGRALLPAGALSALVERLLPLASVVTPNLSEAGALLGRTVSSLGDMRKAARDLHALGPGAVLVTGGHLEGDPVDVLYDGADLVELPAQRVPGGRTHGSGCTLSAAIAALLACGAPVRAAVEEAKAFVAEAIRHGFGLGRGEGPVNPGWALRRDDAPQAARPARPRRTVAPGSSALPG
jgi:hydroxymethylpyrimidine/phosphomethylpyrimidine kinase